ncbi:hypothetical protein [Pseudomonas sp. JUb52]|uniref:hypothetical protein n=1 Tax=Pseudomonas sp. JUb52 TaxID=2485127 RepID=UPI0010441408|nr:hypothetical protein [Pseudomonas sp. JUb52]
MTYIAILYSLDLYDKDADQHFESRLVIHCQPSDDIQKDRITLQRCLETADEEVKEVANMTIIEVDQEFYEAYHRIRNTMGIDAHIPTDHVRMLVAMYKQPIYA